VLDTEPAVANPPRPRPAPTSVDVCFEHVTFAYQPGGSPSLCDVSFHLPQGGRIAIVGPSGAGKTTLVNLLVRFWDPVGGTIRLGGHDLRTYALDDLRRTIGVVSQRTTIFSGTLRHNLLLARPGASDAELLEALSRAGLAELPARSRLGLERWVGEQGMQLSGGERQRLAIARTLLLDAPLLVLDEPTANLDPVTERDLLAELIGAMDGRTTISITHRLIGLEGMDEILVLDAGGIVERGTHAQLAVRDGLYRRMLDAQDQFVDDVGVAGRG
jgi:ATP-binding cassette, subfamily C, bacterial CydC